MSVQLQIEETPNYLIAKFTGAGVAEDVWRQFESIAEQCKRANKNKLLLNFTELRGDVSLHEKYLLVERFTIFAHYDVIKIAGVDKPSRQPTKLRRNSGSESRVKRPSIYERRRCGTVVVGVATPPWEMWVQKRKAGFVARLQFFGDLSPAPETLRTWSNSWWKEFNSQQNRAENRGNFQQKWDCQRRHF